MSTPTVPLALQPRASDRPPREERWGAGATLSAIAHVALVAGLAWSVNWKTDSGETTVEAELWSALPQESAPPPMVTEPAPTPPPEPAPTPAPPPPPPVAEPPAPRAPDIVSEKDDKLKLAKQKLEAQKLLDQQKREKADELKKEQLKADAQKKAEEQKLAKSRADQMARMSGMLDASPNATGTAKKSSGPSAGYGARIQSKIRPNIRPIREFDSSLKTDVELRMGADGTILIRRVVRSSGDAAWDDEALKAVDRTAVLPRDVDGTVPPTMIVTIKPDS